MAGPDVKMDDKIQEELDSDRKDVFSKMGDPEEKPIFKPTAEKDASKVRK